MIKLRSGRNVGFGRQRGLLLNDRNFFSRYMRILTPTGVTSLLGGSLAQIVINESMLFGPLLSRKNGKQIGHVSATANPKDLAYVTDLAASGKIKPVIDKVYSLAEVPDAMRYLEEGHAKGKVVISMRNHARNQ